MVDVEADEEVDDVWLNEYELDEDSVVLCDPVLLIVPLAEDDLLNENVVVVLKEEESLWDIEWLRLADKECEGVPLSVCGDVLVRCPAASAKMTNALLRLA